MRAVAASLRDVERANTVKQATYERTWLASRIVDPAEVIAAVRSGLTGADAGRRFGISRERVRQIVKRDLGTNIPHKQTLTSRCGFDGVLFRDPSHRASHQSARRAAREAQFWSHVDRGSGECWEWTGYCDPNGYGKTHYLRDQGAGGYAHRVAFIYVKGPIGAGLTLDHLCRNPSCVNPDHLEAVTLRENVLRSPLTVAGINARKTHCIRGHEFSPENTALHSRGRGRRCRTCTREKQRGYIAPSRRSKEPVE